MPCRACAARALRRRRRYRARVPTRTDRASGKSHRRTRETPAHRPRAGGLRAANPCASAPLLRSLPTTGDGRQLGILRGEGSSRAGRLLSRQHSMIHLRTLGAMP